MPAENVYLVLVGEEKPRQSFVVLNADSQADAENAVVDSTDGFVYSVKPIRSYVKIKPGHTTVLDLAASNEQAEAPSGPTRESIAAALGVDPSSLSGSLTFTQTTTIEL